MSLFDHCVSVCLSVHLSGLTLLVFGMQIPELLTQRKFVSAECHAHSNDHKSPKPVAPTIFMLEINFN